MARWWMALLIMTLLAGCGTPRPAMQQAPDGAFSSPIVGPVWKLTLLGTDEWWQGDQTAHFTLLPDGKKLRLSGSNGCHPLRGEATLGDGWRIAISGLEDSACPGQPQAAQVAGILSRAYRYLVDHDRLVLMGRDGHVLGGFKRQG